MLSYAHGICLMNDNPSPANSIPERAKQLYTNYYGSSFFMGREGDYEEYKQYNVPSELESQWRAERIAYLAGKLTPDDRDTVIALSIWEAKGALPQLLHLADGEDDHTRLIWANTLWQLATCAKLRYAPSIDPAIEQRAKLIALGIWVSIAEASTLNVVDETWRPWDGSTPEAFLRAWAKSNLEKALDGTLRL